MISELHKTNAYGYIRMPNVSTKQTDSSYKLNQPSHTNHFQLSGFKPYASALISFGYDFKLKSEKGLHCPCCGVEMSTNEEIEEFVESLDGATGIKIIEGIEKFEDRFPEVERSVANRLKIEAEKYTNLNLNGLLCKILNEPKRELEQKQKVILNEIKELSQELTGDTCNIIQKDINAIDKIITEGKDGQPFKRKTLIEGMEKVRENETDSQNKLILDKIVEKTMDMPTSSTDANAFIVKYSRRTTPEIAKRLIEPSQATAEHIKPHSKEGHDGADNYLSECKKCNNDRGNMTYVEWLEIHPEMIKNTQLYMDEIINRIINGTIKGFDFYPYAVKKAVYSESGGKIDLDISKFSDYKNKIKQEKIAYLQGKSNNLNTVI